MLKKISLTFVIALLLVLSACTPSGTEKTDIDIVYEVKNSLSFDNLEVSSDIIIPTSDNGDVQLEWTSSSSEFLSTTGVVTRPGAGEGNKSVSLVVVITLNDAVATKTFEFTILQEESVFDTRFTDELVMDFEYENTDFIADGVGEVSLVPCSLLLIYASVSIFKSDLALTNFLLIISLNSCNSLSE